jgi:hypothetical protein
VIQAGTAALIAEFRMMRVPAPPEPRSATTAGWIPLDLTVDPPETLEKVRETDPQPRCGRAEACSILQRLTPIQRTSIGLILSLNIQSCIDRNLH